MRKRFSRVYLAVGLLVSGLSTTIPVTAHGAGVDESPTISLTLSPAAEPVPALKYRLQYSIEERTKGNAALAYYRTVVQFDPVVHSAGFSKFINDKVQPWLKLPVESFPCEEVARSLEAYHSIFKELERAGRQEECRWDLPLESDGINTLLGEFQSLRWPAQLLTLRARLEISQGDLNAALATLRTGYQLARNLGTARTFIPPLIGVAIATANRAELEAFVQRPGAPNLYWALSELPVPLVDFRSSIEMEARLPDYAFPEIAEFRSRRLSKDEAHRVSQRLLTRWMGINDAGNTVESVRMRFAATAAAEYTADKQVLIAAGRPKNQVEAMPVEQVVWLAADYRWRVASDQLFKWALLPVSQRSEGYARAEQQVGLLGTEERGSPFEFVELLPAVGSVLAAMGGTDRGIAILRTVEAIRLHAALHGGDLPNTLNTIDAVPVPTDPMTGRPFAYRVENGVAVLETPPVPNNRYQGRRYLIQFRK